jgi:hypothetical protein
MDGIAQIERVGQRDDIGDIAVHVVTARRLGRTAMPAAVMRDNTIALLDEEHHLRVPVIRAERPAVVEHDDGRIHVAPVLVEDFGLVDGGDERHSMSPRAWSGTRHATE